jgi:4-hydroxybenzoate polyprenyltransferase
MTSATPTTSAAPAGRSAFAEFAADIKLSHSVFALPFAMLGAFMAAEAAMPGGLPTIGQVALVLACMVLARSFAMGMNRLLDASADLQNPRTSRRAIPSGRLTRGQALTILVACAVGFQFVTLGFGVLYWNWWPALLAMPLLLILGAYPLFKRFTRYCHFYLGFCLSLAPVCAWIAIAGTADLTPLIMAGAVLCWTAGFDILYACQDYASDVETGTFSIPAALGIARALWVARLTHVACLALLVLLGLHSQPLDLIWFVAVGVVGVIFIVEHVIVTPDDLSRINLAFFTLNGIVSLCLGGLGLIDVLI